MSSTDGSPTKTGWNRRSRRGVLLDVLAKLVERGGADAAELAAGQRRLEQVGGVHRPLRLARADDQVELVDEEDDPPFGLGDLLEHRLEPLLELAAKLGAGDQRPHVERDHAAVLEALGDVARDDPLRQALDDRRLAHPGLADQDRVVLGPAAEHLDHPADLGIAADHRVHLAPPGQLDQVAAVLLERLVLVLGVLIGHLLAAADLLERLEHRLLGHPQRREQVLGLALDLGQAEQQMLDRDELVLHPAGFVAGLLEDAAEIGADRRLAARSPWAARSALPRRPSRPGRD